MSAPEPRKPVSLSESLSESLSDAHSDSLSASHSYSDSDSEEEEKTYPQREGDVGGIRGGNRSETGRISERKLDGDLAAAIDLFGAQIVGPPTLWPHQARGIEMLDAVVAAGSRAPIVVMPTGAGKTIFAAAVTQREAAGKRVVFLAPRRELIEQTEDKMLAFSVRHGVVMSGRENEDPGARVQLCSVDTLVSHARRGIELPAADIVFIDECHLSITKCREGLLARWPEALRIGLTATPSRKDGRALGVLYDRIIEPTTTGELTERGFLAPARYFSWPTPDLRGVRVTAGDYNLADLEQRMNKAPLLGDIVTHSLAHAGGRQSIVFGVSIAHAVALAEAFRRAGVTAEHVDAGTPAKERAATFARFRAGATQILANCFLAAYGFDVPPVSAIVIARPTRSLVLYLQMLGRGLRVADGKPDCIVLDHSGSVHRFGFATDERLWTLAGKYAIDPTASRAREKAPAKECPKCHAVFAGAPTCPECGYDLRPPKKLVPTLDGQLVEVGSDLHFRDLAQRDVLRETAERREFYRELKGVVADRGYKPGFAAAKYRERYGDWPPYGWRDDDPVAPSLATERWVKSRAIAWAKSRGAA